VDRFSQLQEPETVHSIGDNTNYLYSGGIKMSGMRFVGCTIIGFVFFLLCGCSGPTIVGKWNGQMDIQGVSLTTQLDFKEGGAFHQTSRLPIGEMSATGNYKIDGEKLNMHITSLNLGKSQLPVPDSAATQNATFKIDGEKMMIMRDGKSMEFNRVKE
jgi:hypothetical protein